jgi:hypothetical protein
VPTYTVAVEPEASAAVEQNQCFESPETTCNSTEPCAGEFTPTEQPIPKLDINHARGTSQFASEADIASVLSNGTVLNGYFCYFASGTSVLCYQRVDGDGSVFKVLCVAPKHKSTEQILSQLSQAFSASGHPVLCTSFASLETAVKPGVSNAPGGLFLSTCLVSVSAQGQGDLNKLLPKNLRDRGYTVKIIKQREVNRMREDDAKTPKICCFQTRTRERKTALRAACDSQDKPLQRGADENHGLFPLSFYFDGRCQS